MNAMTSVAMLVGMTLACTAHAGPPAGTKANGGASEARVAVDAASGRLRQPTRDELQALSRQTRQPATRTGKPMPATREHAQRTTRKLRDGSIMAEVSEDMLSNVTAVVHADGTVSIAHEGERGEQEGGDHE